jgi:hypothetical protein
MAPTRSGRDYPYVTLGLDDCRKSTCDRCPRRSLQGRSSICSLDWSLQVLKCGWYNAYFYRQLKQDPSGPMASQPRPTALPLWWRYQTPNGFPDRAQSDRSCAPRGRIPCGRIAPVRRRVGAGFADARVIHGHRGSSRCARGWVRRATFSARTQSRYQPRSRDLRSALTDLKVSQT